MELIKSSHKKLIRLGLALLLILKLGTAYSIGSDTLNCSDTIKVQFFCSFSGKYEIYWKSERIFFGRVKRSRPVDTIVLELVVDSNFRKNYESINIPLSIYRKRSIFGYHDLEIAVPYSCEHPFLVLYPDYRLKRKYLITWDWSEYRFFNID